MSLKRIAELCVAMGAGAILVLAANTPAPNRASKADRDFRMMRADAGHVRSAAVELERIANQPGAKWTDCDAQWNAMKPSVEDMDFRLIQLTRIKASLNSGQQSQIDQAAKLVQEIRSRTRQLRRLLDKPGVQPTDKMFSAYGRDLAREARQLERVRAAS